MTHSVARSSSPQSHSHQAQVSFNVPLAAVHSCIQYTKGCCPSPQKVRDTEVWERQEKHKSPAASTPFHTSTPTPLRPAEASALTSCRCVHESRSTQTGTVLETGRDRGAGGHTKSSRPARILQPNQTIPAGLWQCHLEDTHQVRAKHYLVVRNPYALLQPGSLSARISFSERVRPRRTISESKRSTKLPNSPGLLRVL